ncbi:MAG: universal stress protein [Desulfatiglandaceae bacterium]
MARAQNNRILIVLDGSKRAFEGVTYISNIPSLQEMEVVFLHIFCRVPQTYLDFESQPLYAQEVRDLRGWAIQEKGDLRDYMEKAKQCLVKAGFSNDAVHIDIREMEAGITRDIIEEAKHGRYAAVVAGRRGVSRLSSILLGNVAFKLLERLSFVPLALVGINPQPGKILIGIDGSESCLKGVDTVSSYFRDNSLDVMLLHVVRSEDPVVIKEAGERIEPVFEDARRRLVKSGFESSKIAPKIISDVESRAGAIVEEAQAGGYGTIIVGRRGFSRVHDFFMGRVSNKVVQLAVEQAVWVVG